MANSVLPVASDYGEKTFSSFASAVRHPEQSGTVDSFQPFLLPLSERYLCTTISL